MARRSRRRHHHDILQDRPAEARRRDLWRANDLIGGGIVKALGVLPSGDPIEFGQYTQDNESRCYLRRRDPGGWNTVLRDVLPGLTCAPIDAKIDADGAITLLAYRTGVGGTEWWLGQLSSWDAGVTPAASAERTSSPSLSAPIPPV
ncbi:MAG: hypothetical protein IPK80_16045 [Nannocystis sp.]|nr:hypothetical protein [Nannocystis sp.]